MAVVRAGSAEEAARSMEDDAPINPFWLALLNTMAKWSHATYGWKAATNQFAILYEDCFTKNHLLCAIDSLPCT